MTISLLISCPHTGQLKRLFDLGATVTAVAFKESLKYRLQNYSVYATTGWQKSIVRLGATETLVALRQKEC